MKQNTTNASTFDYVATNFGLINQTYPSDPVNGGNLSQWQRFNRLVYDMNQLAPSNTVYKLLFIGRHGEGYHNAEYGNYCLDGASYANVRQANIRRNAKLELLLF